jgi:Transglycosylase SLT domain
MLKRILTPLVIASVLIPTTPASAAESPSQTFKCPAAMKIAREAGFRKSDLATLDRIIWRESKCEPKAVGWNYRSGMDYTDCRRQPWPEYRRCKAVRSADFGLTQINDVSWVTYLRQHKIIKSSADLLNPMTNLKAAKALYDYSVGRGYSAWKQWDTSKPQGSGNVSSSATRKPAGNGRAPYVATATASSTSMASTPPSTASRSTSPTSTGPRS